MIPARINMVLSENPSNFSPLSMMFAVGFCRCVYQLENYPLYFQFTESFCYEMEFCQRLFSASIDSAM